jgi:hypothetical protein
MAMKITTKFAVAVVATGLAIAPVAAQAGTRAESSPIAVDAARASAPVDAENDLAKKGFSLVWLLLLLAVIAAVVAAASGGRTRGG